MNKTVLSGLVFASLSSTALYAQADDTSLSQPEAAGAMVFDKAHPTIELEGKQAYAALELRVGGVTDGAPIPDKFAYCIPDGKGQSKDGENISPSVTWLGAPSGTQSYTLIVVDDDVPADFTNANQPAKELPVNAPRQPFYHWVVADIPATSLGFIEGADSKGITPGGKTFGRKHYGIDGRNDYAKMGSGDHGGYDGPCPPWNDLRMHHYHFQLYALDIPSLGLRNPLTGPQALSVMKNHILARGEITVTYSTNPRWLAQMNIDKANTSDMIPGEKFDVTQ